jgi:hypothetical protein
MRRSTMVALGVAAFLAGAAAQPAFAGYGALAYDEANGKYGLSANEATQAKAEEVAIKICGGDKCKVVFRTAAKECGAIATEESGTAWGAGKRPQQRAAAELAAIQNCQKRTKGQCKLRGAECNK